MNYVSINSSIISTITIYSERKIHLKGNNNMQVVDDSQNLGNKCVDCFQHLEGNIMATNW
jgi:hypothetical protein